MNRKPRIACAGFCNSSGRVTGVPNGELPCRPRPCTECPWRKDLRVRLPDGLDGYCHAARSAYAPPENRLAICHMGLEKAPHICAGWLLRGADNNRKVHEARVAGRIPDGAITDGRYELHETFRAMAVANGLSPDDPALEKCLP